MSCCAVSGIKNLKKKIWNRKLKLCFCNVQQLRTLLKPADSRPVPENQPSAPYDLKSQQYDMIHKIMVPEPDALFSISTTEDPVHKQEWNKNFKFVSGKQRHLLLWVYNYQITLKASLGAILLKHSSEIWRTLISNFLQCMWNGQINSHDLFKNSGRVKIWWTGPRTARKSYQSCIIQGLIICPHIVQSLQHNNKQIFSAHLHLRSTREKWISAFSGSASASSMFISCAQVTKMCERAQGWMWTSQFVKVPTLTYGHDICIMNDQKRKINKNRSQISDKLAKFNLDGVKASVVHWRL